MSASRVALVGLSLVVAVGGCRGPASPSFSGGAAVAARIDGLPLQEREQVLRGLFAAGAVAARADRFAPVELRAEVDGRERVATVWVACDYLGVGADDDWLRTPVTPGLAQEVADARGCVLPTRRIVDAIWQQADVRVAPRPFHPDDFDIVSVDVFRRSHQAIEAQLQQAGARPGQLVAGHKKDVVVSPLLSQWPDRVVIYGWHRRDGAPIQPLSKVHTWPHVDYSHGIRLVRQQALLDGQPTTVAALLADPALHVLLSDEGPFAARYRTRAAQ